MRNHDLEIDFDESNEAPNVLHGLRQSLCSHRHTTACARLASLMCLIRFVLCARLLVRRRIPRSRSYELSSAKYLRDSVICLVAFTLSVYTFGSFLVIVRSESFFQIIPKSIPKTLNEMYGSVECHYPHKVILRRDSDHSPVFLNRWSNLFGRENNRTYLLTQDSWMIYLAQKLWIHH